MYHSLNRCLYLVVIRYPRAERAGEVFGHLSVSASAISSSQSLQIQDLDKERMPLLTGLPLWTRDELAQGYVLLITHFCLRLSDTTQVAIPVQVSLPVGRTSQGLWKLISGSE